MSALSYAVSIDGSIEDLVTCAQANVDQFKDGIVDKNPLLGNVYLLKVAIMQLQEAVEAVEEESKK